jgi:hypothetical protein
VHEIPHLVWYHRGEQRLVEYGSSFAALRRAGTRRGILDAIFRMNEEHLSRNAVTLYESVEDAGRVAAAVNIICYRGRTPHVARIPGVTRAAHGPKRFFYFNLFESDETGAPFRPGARQAGGNDKYAGAVGRWLVTRDGFDLLVYYLSDYDYASHALGPDAAHEALARSDAALGALVEAAGGLDAFLERYALIVCADHGQTPVREVASLAARVGDAEGVLVTASNRAGQLYDLAGRGDAATLAALLDGEPSVGVALYREDGAAVARREREELRFRPGDQGWELDGDGSILDQPNALERAWRALANPNAGDVLVSAAPGWEFADLGGRHHLGGGSHGSLEAGDSEVPVLTIGLDGEPRSITELAPQALRALGVRPPAYAPQLGRAA